MGKVMAKKSRVSGLALWISIIMVCSFVTNALYLPTSIQAEAADTLYDFTQVNVAESGISVIDAETELGPYGWELQSYGLKADTYVQGEYITFELSVPESASYAIYLQGANSSGGGIGALSIDGVALEDYNFYAAAYTAAAPEQKLGMLPLTAGTHKLKLMTNGQPSGSWGMNMYPGKLRLAKEAIPVAPAAVSYDFKKVNEENSGISVIEAETDVGSSGWELQPYGLKTDTYTQGEYISFQIEVPVTATYAVYFQGANASGGGIGALSIDGTALGDYNFYAETYTPAAPEQKQGVLLLSAGSHKLKVMTDGQPSGSWGMNMYLGKLRLAEEAIPVVPDNVLYDFTKVNKNGSGIAVIEAETEIGNSGWELQSYGLKTDSYAEGEHITFQLDVPANGIYAIYIQGANAAGGGIGAWSMDGQALGSYNFYAADYTATGLNQYMRTLELTAGSHKLLLTASGMPSGSWGMNLYPSKLNMVSVAKLPDLLEVEASVRKNLLLIGQSVKVSVKGTFDDGYQGAFLEGTTSFTSSNSQVASVDDTGSITAIGAGTADITATVNIRGTQQQAVVAITVSDKQLGSVEIHADSLEVVEGQTLALSVTGKLTDGADILLDEDATIHFTSLNNEVAEVDESGLVTGVAKGNATIQVEVTLGSTTISGELDLTVLGLELAQVLLTLPRDELYVGQTAKSKLVGVLNNGEIANLSAAGTEITYESDDSSVATINVNGTVNALTPGTVVLRATVQQGTTVISGEASLDVISTTDIKSAKQRQTIYTVDKIQNARDNIVQFDWARKLKDEAVTAADAYVAKGNDYWWNLVTPQTLPRGYAVNEDLGSPVTGREIDNFGTYPYTYDPLNNPWKITDPSSGFQFPTNDFASYYASGLDAQGLFDPVKAKATGSQYLVNTLYPEKGEHWGVDDGTGWVDDNGHKYTFIAYYNHWALWETTHGLIPRALNALRDAYLYTGDVKYARTGSILLDRIADVYPDMDVSAYSWDDGFRNSHGGTGQGKVLGSIWESLLVPELIKAYDAFFPAMDDEEITGFLQSKVEEFQLNTVKSSGAAIRKNIEDGLLKQVYPAMKTMQINGNTGMHQSALALAAIVYDTFPETKDWLDFDFQAGAELSSPWRLTGGNLGPLLVNNLDRDGMGNEAAPEYNRLWFDQLKQVADVLKGYDKYPDADMYLNPKFKKMFTAFYPLILSDKYTAAIGDSGGTAKADIIVKADDFISGFEVYRDPLLAQLAYFYNGNKTEGIRGDIFDADPEQIADEIHNVIEEYGTLVMKSDNMTGYGFTALRDGTNYNTKAGITYDFSKMDVVSSTVPYNLYASSSTIQLEAEKAGESIAFNFPVSAEGTYDLDLVPFKATSYGQYDIYLDGAKAGSLSFYGTSGAGSAAETIVSDVHLSAGNHEISFVGTGKEELANNYKMGVITLSLLDEAAQAIRDQAGSKGNEQRDLWLYYGRSSGHGHRDTLNLGLHAFGLDMAPDLGYPERTGEWPSRMEWTSNTISHNTVVVDKGKQEEQWGGLPQHFAAEDEVKLIDVEAPDAYPQTSQYRRTSVMIKVDASNSYYLDLFRVTGGSDHAFSFHGGEGTVTTEGLNLVPQATGTYAGPQVDYGVRTDSVAGWGYMGSGFHYLKNVEKDTNPAGPFSVDWSLKSDGTLPVGEQAHLKLTMLNKVDDVALADGIPPVNGSNPDKLKYMVAHSSGDNLNSVFTSVLQPYVNEPYIVSASEVSVVNEAGQAVGKDKAVAVKVTLANGRTDYIIQSLDAEQLLTIDGKIKFQGFLGVYSESEGQPVYGYVNDGTLIGLAGQPLVQENVGRVTGTVEDFTKTLSMDNTMTINADLHGQSASSLVGESIYVDNDGERNAVYTIQGIQQTADHKYKLDLGDQTLIRSYTNSNDPNAGYIYDVLKGNTFRIPLSNGSNIPDESTSTVPSAPTGVTAVAGNGMATVSFTAPESDGGSAITGYTVTSSPGGITATGATSPISINGLNNGTAYSFTVIATNSVGNSLASAASATVTPTAPATVPDVVNNTVNSSGTGLTTPVVSDYARITVNEIKPNAEGKVTIALKQEQKGILLDQNILLLLKDTGLILTSDDISLTVPEATIRKALSDQAAGTVDRLLSISFQDLSKVESDKLLVNVQPKGNVGWKLAGPVLTLDISWMVDGKKVSDFILPVAAQAAFRQSKDMNPDLLGVYRIADTGELTYLAGKTEENAVEVPLQQSGTYAVLEYDRSFADVPSTHWALAAIKQLAAKHIVEGVTDTNFAPDQKVTRAEFTALLVRTLQLNEKGSSDEGFKDIGQNAWYATDVALAIKAGLVQGTGAAEFSPNRAITREEMVVMLMRAYVTLNGQANLPTSPAVFSDRSNVNGWAQEALDQAAQLGLVKGDGAGLFRPDAATGRAEAAQMLVRLLQSQS